MKAKDILILFNRIETKFPVDTWKIDDVHIWPVIRLDLMFHLHYESSTYLKTKIDLKFKAKQASRMAQDIRNYYHAVHKDKLHNQKIGRADALFLTDSDVRTNIAGSWQDKMCDPFIAYFDKKKISHVALEKSTKYRLPRYRSSFFIQPKLNYWLLKRYLIDRVTTHDEQLAQFEEFLAFTKKQQVNIPMPTRQRVKTIMKAIFAYAEYFDYILKQVEPKIVFVVSYPNPVGMALLLACHRRKIANVDIQHGVQGEYNAAYGQWQRVPTSGYELLPTYFWTWSKNDAETIYKWSNKLKIHKPIVGGNLFLNSWLDKRNKETQLFEKSITDISKKTNILVTLSLQEDQNMALLRKIISVSKHGDRTWQFWIRLHPTELHRGQGIKQYVSKKGLKNYNLDLATNLPLYALLRHTTVHITNTSATVIEAEAFGVPSIITSEDGTSYFREQVANKTAIVALTSEDIVKAMKKISQGDTSLKARSDWQRIEQSGLRQIEQLIER